VLFPKGLDFSAKLSKKMEMFVDDDGLFLLKEHLPANLLFRTVVSSCVKDVITKTSRQIEDLVRGLFECSLKGGDLIF